MKKRCLAIVLVLCFVASGFPGLTMPVLAASSFEFCGIDLTLESGNRNHGKYEFVSQEDTWVTGTEEYEGVSDYIMSTNCDKLNETYESEEFNDTIYTAGFTMPYTGNVKFKASVSGESRFDYLVVLADGIEVFSTQDMYNETWEETPWIDISVMVSKDSEVKIGYLKDGSETSFEDRAYVAELSLENVGITFSDEIADTTWYNEAAEEFNLSTKEQLCGFSKLVNEGISFENCVINLSNDIDMSGVVWIPAGQYHFDLYYNDNIRGLNASFKGTFNGHGYAISNLLCKYTYPYTTYIGFIAINYGIIKDLVMVNPIIGDGGIAKSAGAIAGFNNGLINNCAVKGGKIDIAWDRYYMAYAGGLVGTNGYVYQSQYYTELNQQGGVIGNCYSDADVQVKYTHSRMLARRMSSTETYFAAAGGLLGTTYGGLIVNSYATGDVNAIAEYINDSRERVSEPVNTYALSGGFIGMVLSTIPEDDARDFGREAGDEPVIAEIKDCYATGKVTATGPSAGTSLKSGFIGFARNMTPLDQTPTYLLEVTNSYFDTETSGRTNGFKNALQFDGVTGKTSVEMKNSATFTPWDFSNSWSRYDSVNNGYPVLNRVGVGVVYKVSFVDYNDEILKIDYRSKGESATAPMEPSREGYTFIGWDSAFNSITADITVKAKYNVNEVSLGNFVVEGVDGTSLDSDTVLSVEQVSQSISATDKASYNIQIKGLSDGKELVDLFDIKLLLNNLVIQPGGKVKVKIKLTSDQLTYGNLEIMYIDDNGNMTIIPSTIEDGYIVFVTDHFSKYGIIGKPLGVAVNTGDATSTVPFFMLLLSAGAYLVIIGKRKLKELRIR